MSQKHSARMEQCRRVVTHYNPHPDEITELWIPWKWGEYNFPGIRKAEIIFTRVGGLFEGKAWRQHWHEGTLLLGIADSPFNEHPFMNVPRKEGECGATLMAKFLGVDDNPTVARILKYILANDLHGTRHGFLDFVSIVRDAQLFGTLSQKEVLFMGMDILENFYEKEVAFFRCEQEIKALEQAGRVKFFQDRLGRMAVTVQGCDNPEMGKFLRGKGISLVATQNGRGQVRISANQQTLAIFGTIADLVKMHAAFVEEEWHDTGWALLNGSHSYPDTPATKIPFEDIITILGLSMLNT